MIETLIESFATAIYIIISRNNTIYLAVIIHRHTLNSIVNVLIDMFKNIFPNLL